MGAVWASVQETGPGQALRIGTHHWVLDYGCGSGADTLELAAQLGPGGRAVGVDRSRVLLAKARQLGAGSGLPVEFHLAEGERLGFADRSFDLCRVRDTLVHESDPLAVLGEIRRVLRPGGSASIEEFDYAGLLLDAPEPMVTDLVIGRVGRYFHGPGLGRQLRRYAVDAGFEDVRSMPSLQVLPDFPTLDRMLFVTDRVTDLMEEGILATDLAHAWLSALRMADRSGRFCCYLPKFSLVATRH